MHITPGKLSQIITRQWASHLLLYLLSKETERTGKRVFRTPSKKKKKKKKRQRKQKYLTVAGLWMISHFLLRLSMPASASCRLHKSAVFRGIITSWRWWMHAGWCGRQEDVTAAQWQITLRWQHKRSLITIVARAKLFILWHERWAGDLRSLAQLSNKMCVYFLCASRLSPSTP